MRAPDAKAGVPSARLSTGVPGLDDVVGGGLVRASTTLLLAPSGCGKTVLGLQFLAEGARRGEKGLYYGFFEQPALIVAKGDRLGFDFARAIDAGTIHIEWRRAAELLLDAIASELLTFVERHGIQRLFIDGFAAFHAAGEPERVATVFATLTAAFASSGVTVLISDETRELFVRNVEVPTHGVSALFQNILFLRRIETADECLERTIAVMKTRDSGHDGRIWDFEITDDAGMRVRAPRTKDGGRRTLTAGTGASSTSRRSSPANKKRRGGGKR